MRINKFKHKSIQFLHYILVSNVLCSTIQPQNVLLMPWLNYYVRSNLFPSISCTLKNNDNRLPIVKTLYDVSVHEIIFPLFLTIDKGTEMHFNVKTTKGRNRENIRQFTKGLPKKNSSVAINPKNNGRHIDFLNFHVHVTKY